MTRLSSILSRTILLCMGIVPAAALAQSETVTLVPPNPQVEPTVTVTSHPGDSISSNYNIDFTAMDSNGDGNIVRAEVNASGNADLMREFHVVDRNNNGRLTREELKGWLS